jgi:hypothetical protein
LLVHDQLGRRVPPGQSHHQVVAETKRLVVPAMREVSQRQVDEIGMLVAQQPGHEFDVDVVLSTQHFSHDTSCSPPVTIATASDSRQPYSQHHVAVPGASVRTRDRRFTRNEMPIWAALCGP